MCIQICQYRLYYLKIVLFSFKSHYTRPLSIPTELSDTLKLWVTVCICMSNVDDLQKMKILGDRPDGTIEGNDDSEIINKHEKYICIAHNA